MARFIEWHDQADDHDEDGRPDLAVRWYGGATFQVWCDGQLVDAATHYSDVGEGQDPTLHEAFGIATSMLAAAIAPADWSTSAWPGRWSVATLANEARRLASRYENAAYERGAAAAMHRDDAPNEHLDRKRTEHEVAGEAWEAWLQRHTMTPLDRRE